MWLQGSLATSLWQQRDAEAFTLQIHLHVDSSKYTVQGYSRSGVLASPDPRIAIQMNEAAWHMGTGWSPRWSE